MNPSINYQFRFEQMILLTSSVIERYDQQRPPLWIFDFFYSMYFIIFFLELWSYLLSLSVRLKAA